MKVIEYFLVCGKTGLELRAQILPLLREGFVPHGGPVYANGDFHQAMVKRVAA